MSWQEYVDSSLVGSGLIAQAAIVGHDGTLWATSSNLSLGTEEIAGVIKALQDIKAAYNGLMLAGEKYVLIRGDDEALYLRTGKGGAALVKTGQCILIGLYEGENTQLPSAFKVVEELGDYLRSVGY